MTIHSACAVRYVNWRLHPALPVDVRLLGAGLIALGASYYYYSSDPALDGVSSGDGDRSSGAAGGGDSERAGKLNMPSCMYHQAVRCLELMTVGETSTPICHDDSGHLLLRLGHRHPDCSSQVQRVLLS